MRIVGGSRKGKKLISPNSSIIRPTSERIRESVFDMLVHRDYGGQSITGSKVMDLFAGTGALGLEALSRGADQLISVELEHTAAHCIKKNIELLNFTDRAKVIRADACNLRVAKNKESACSFVFVDPPYGKNLACSAINQIFQGGWLTSKAVAVVETGAKDEFSQPKGFTTIDRRVYCGTQIIFLQVSQL